MKYLPPFFIMAFFALPLCEVPAQSALTCQVVYHGDFESQGADLTILDLFEFSSGDALGEVRPVAYFSAHFEKNRPDSHQFGRKLEQVEGCPSVRYIDWTDEKNRRVMLARLKLAKQKGFLAVDIDHLNGPDAVPYFEWLLGEAKALGLRVGLRNAGELLARFGKQVDFFVSLTLTPSELVCYRKYEKPVVRMAYNKDESNPAFVSEVISGQAGNRF